MAEILVLRVIHVLGGMFWVGGMFFNSFFLMPAMVQAGPAAGPVMGGLQRRRLFVVLPIVALLTILAGIRLLWITSGGFAPEYFSTGRGLTFGASGGAAIVAFILGMAVTRPAGTRMAYCVSRWDPSKTLRRAHAWKPRSASCNGGCRPWAGC